MALGLGLLVSGMASAQTYCPSDGGSGNVFNIARVQFAGIDNASGDNNGYGDFTALTATVDAGTSYGITVDPTGPFFLRYRWRTWIDWNNDGAFGAGELVFERTGFGQETGTIAVPAGVTPGAKRMRVNMSAFVYQGACANYQLGEVEDYTVTVNGACTADAGTLTVVKPFICFDGISAAVVANADGNAVVPAGYSTLYVLTNGPGLVIEQVGVESQFIVTEPGSYTIHTLIYDPNTLDLSVVILGQTTGFDVNGLLQQGGGSICGSLDVAGGAVVVSNPDAGTLSGGGNVCAADENTLVATPNGDANVPDGYTLAYVLTSGTELTIQQLGAAPSFTVSGNGLYTIHSFVFPSDLDLSVVVPGTTTGGDVLALLAENNICASLLVAGAQFNVAAPNAGTLTADAEEVCFEVGTVVISATPNGDINVPSGYSVIYVLTEGTGLVLQAASATPSFVVSAVGNYTVHTLVYDPATLNPGIVEFGVTTGFDVNGLLVQGGGAICGSLDVAGAQTAAVECGNECLADAGTLSGGGDVCNNTGDITLEATANGDSNVPVGFNQAYVLTSGPELTIQALGAAPEFNVVGGGLYTIHSFVFPASLDLSVVVIGETTGGDVLALLAANNICASLDVAGAAFNIVAPNAGTLTAEGSSVCLVDGVAILSAIANGNSNTPDGYSLAYVLTSGTELTIQQLGATPNFEVTSAGLYTIHTFVFPSDLDLSVVVPGTTTGGDVLALLAANDICASLDVAGAPIEVTECSTECLADAGDITPDDFIVCRQGGSATVIGVPAGNAVVPAGYQTLYVLTRGFGLTIRQVSPTPQFTVNQLGFYTVHTLVFDPATLDLSGVVFGQTTGFDVNSLLIQGGGTICASLDVQGAPFLVVGPFLCSILSGFNGIVPQTPAELANAMNSMGLNADTDAMLLNTIENDAPMSVMNVYPNPTRDILNLELMVMVDSDLELSVLNALGQEAMPGTSLNVGQGPSRSTLDVSALPAGAYLIRLTAKDKVVTHRFTKVD